MIGEISKWAPGIPLGWALASAVVGLAILVVIGGKLWMENRE